MRPVTRHGTVRGRKATDCFRWEIEVIQFCVLIRFWRQLSLFSHAISYKLENTLETQCFNRISIWYIFSSPTPPLLPYTHTHTHTHTPCCYAAGLNRPRNPFLLAAKFTRPSKSCAPESTRETRLVRRKRPPRERTVVDHLWRAYQQTADDCEHTAEFFPYENRSWRSGGVGL